MKRYLNPKQILQLVESGLGNRGDIGSLIEKIREQKDVMRLEFNFSTCAVTVRFSDKDTLSFLSHNELIDNLFDALIWCAKANDNNNESKRSDC